MELLKALAGDRFARHPDDKLEVVHKEGVDVGQPSRPGVIVPQDPRQVDVADLLPH